MEEQKEIWIAWTPLGLMMPSLGLKTKQAPKAEVGGITLKRASMLPLLDSIAYTNKKGKNEKVDNGPHIYFHVSIWLYYLIQTQRQWQELEAKENSRGEMNSLLS